MTAAVIALLIAGWAATLAMLWYQHHGATRRHEASLLQQRGRRRVVITLDGGEAFAGVLYDVDHEALVLREARQLAVGPSSQHVDVDGEVLILRSDVAYLQVP